MNKPIYVQLSALCVILLGSAAAIVAQAPTISFTTANQMRAEAGTPGATWVQSVPAGYQGPGLLLAQAPTALVQSEWGLLGPLSWQQSVAVNGAAPDFAETAANELLVELTAAVSTPVRLEMRRTLTLSAGATAPSFGIDVGDDGSFELTETTAATISVAVVLGPQPLTLRMRSQLSQIGPGSIDLDLHVDVVPDNNLLIFPALQPCGSTSLYVYPSFVDRGIESLWFGGLDPVVLVFGLQAQPLLLPPTTGTQCLLLPSPDLLLLVPYLDRPQLPLPAAVRPVTLWVQAVALGANGLTSTNAFTVVAN